MAHPYDVMYLNDAMNNLAEAIKKANVSYVMSLARALNCTVEDLIQ